MMKSGFLHLECFYFRLFLKPFVPRMIFFTAPGYRLLNKYFPKAGVGRKLLEEARLSDK
jgi:hypothetical protein